MKKDLIEMVFILDRSGSMSGLEKDTIGGFNSLIEKQKKVPGEALISTVLFDDQFQVIHSRKNIHEIMPMTSNEYYVRGSTALLDAIGRSIIKIMNTHVKLSEDQKPEKTLFVITTDGMENASREYHKHQIKSMIENQKEKFGWEFIFLGANIDAVMTARDFGIASDRVANYHADEDGVQLNYHTINEAVREFRVNHSISPDWKSDIDRDFTERKKVKS
jgi:uncharacterized protein YegL